MDENVYRSAYVVCLGHCGWVQWLGIFDISLAVNYRTFGSGRRKLVDNTATNNAYHVILLLRQSSLTRTWDARLCIFTPNFDGFGGIWSLNVVFHRADPKRHFLAWLRVIWAIVCQNPPTGHFNRRVRGKIRSVSGSGNRHPIPTDRVPAVAMIGWHVARLLGCGLQAQWLTKMASTFKRSVIRR